MVMLVGIIATAIATQLMFQQDQVHSSSRVSEIEHSEIFSHPQENQLTLWFFVKFNLYCSFSFPNVGSVLCIYLYKTSKCLWPIYYVCCEMNDFFNVFINHFPKIHRSVLHKITIDLFYFWDTYDVNLWEKLAVTVKPCYIEARF